MPRADHGKHQERNHMNNKVSELELLDINIQLFAGDDESENLPDTDPGVVDQEQVPPSDIDEEYTPDNLDDDYEDAPQEGYEPQDLDVDDEESTPKPRQSPEENEQFKKIRLKAEEQARAKVEAEFAERQAEVNAKLRAIEEKEAEKRVLDSYLTQDKIYEKADEEGVSEEVAKKLILADAQQVIAEERNKVRERALALESQRNMLRADRHFPLLEKEVDEFLAANPNSGLDFQTVYYHRKGQKGDELDKKLIKNAEKRTMANVQDRARRRLGGGDGGSDQDVTPSSVLTRDGMTMASVFGTDPRDLARYVNTKLKG